MEVISFMIYLINLNTTMVNTLPITKTKNTNRKEYKTAKTPATHHTEGETVEAITELPITLKW